MGRPQRWFGNVRTNLINAHQGNRMGSVYPGAPSQFGGQWKGLKVEVAVDAPKTADGIVKHPVIGRGKILLNITGIIMIRDIDDL
jgi:hypothetical protein